MVNGSERFKKDNSKDKNLKKKFDVSKLISNERYDGTESR